jgi:hypothetical protein
MSKTLSEEVKNAEAEKAVKVKGKEEDKENPFREKGDNRDWKRNGMS